MAYDASVLIERLRAVARESGSPRRYFVAFSGGMDSAALLHSLADAAPAEPVIALHVDHGLHDASDEWARRAGALAESLGVAFESVRVAVDASGGRGLEAAAREARYGVFRRRLEAGDWLLSAHHRDDQGETLLLNLLRGSGPLGLAAMPAARPLGAGMLVRPLLGVGRDELSAYARAVGLDWVDDPANSDPRFDRNFLRHDILPRLAARWTDVGSRLANSAGLSAEAQGLLDELAAGDLDDVAEPPGDRLVLDRLRRLGRPRQRNLVRYACRVRGLPLPPAARLESALGTVPDAADDAQPRVAWNGAEIRRYRGRLFLLDALPRAPNAAGALLRPGEDLPLGAGFGQLSLDAANGPGIPRAVAETGLALAFRRGGERLRLAAGGPTRTLKNLLQEHGVLPWMRDSLPLLELGDDLVAVADLWVNADFLADEGFRVVWRNRPTLT